MSLDNSQMTVSDSAHNLGVVLENQLCFSSYISMVILCFPLQYQEDPTVTHYLCFSSLFILRLDNCSLLLVAYSCLHLSSFACKRARRWLFSRLYHPIIVFPPQASCSCLHQIENAQACLKFVVVCTKGLGIRDVQRFVKWFKKNELCSE